MTANSIYSQIIESKTGLQLPLLQNGKSIDSRYDPKKESLRLFEEIKDDTHFLIVIGIAGGFLLETILEKRKDIFILALEKSQADIAFLQELPLIKKISENKNLCFCTRENLETKILELYVPAFYGNLQVIELRGWTLENKDCIADINSAINKACGLVSADFSVQSHFGKLWNHNILSNLSNIHKISLVQNFNLPLDKKALIVAAGPSLDDTIKTIQKEVQDYYIIATDTALSILSSSGIIPQAVISLDGQNISSAHFLHNKSSDLSNTLFLFDLCANSSAVKAVLNKNYNISFFTSGHPLSEYINRFFNLGLTRLFSGAGTVTISALDFAIKAGFKNIFVAGADFAYSKGKPYAKGTYLDRLYNQKSNKINSIQFLYSNLQYRTPLIKEEDTYTTQILQAYKYSFENFLQSMALFYKKENYLYNISNKGGTIFKPQNINTKNGKDLVKELKKIYAKKENTVTFNSFYELKESDISLLPLISWIRNHDNKSMSDFKYFYKEALSIFNELGEN